MIEDDEIIDTLTYYMNITLEGGEVPQTWFESNTVLIPKINKPGINDFRPLALTNVLYKAFMAIMKDKIEYHLKQNGLIDDLQAGSMKGRGTIDNVYILR